MTPQQAQDIAEQWANLHSDKVTLGEIKLALVTLANWYEDTRHVVDILKSSTWQSMNDKMIVQRVIEILEGK